jgi:hypothetical protein
MTKDQKTYLLLGGGALALFAWYQYRRTGSFSFGSLLGGQGTAGSGSLNTSFSGSSPGGTVGGGSSSISESERLRLRALATGAGSRGVCLFPARWIDTSTAPYYGLCVSQANFDKWVRTAGWTGSGQPSLAYVQQVLSRP